MGYGKAVLIGVDQLANAILGGWPDETLSSRAWRWDIAGRRAWPRKLIDGAARLFGDRNHCKESYESERLGRQSPPELR
ncbi:pseudouridine synthase [Desulfovibrio sp. SGI.169]|uniref:pseudouridine synthase n=1 Tax=Desulfovibrio sp. SGI.169 TaxID=3420561 RepID=UPI003D013A72